MSTTIKYALVTGGSRGIGCAIAERLARDGYYVVINYKSNDTAAQQILQTIIQSGGQAELLKFDVTSPAAIQEAYTNWCTAHKGAHFDVLINNAQASASGVTIENHTTEQFNLAMYSGLYATFYYMKACYPYLKETKGTVINFASGAGLFGNKGQSSYAAAKEGIRGLSRVAATEWGPDGINVNVICPLAWTAQLEGFEKAYPEAFKANVKMPPAGHFGDPELEIGRVCVQLANPDFKYMTGETITLEGGLGLRP